MDDGEGEEGKAWRNSISADTDLLFEKVIVKLGDQTAKASLALRKRLPATSGIEKWWRDLFKVQRHES